MDKVRLSDASVIVNGSVTREAITRKQERNFLKLSRKMLILVDTMTPSTFFFIRDFVFRSFAD